MRTVMLVLGVLAAVAFGQWQPEQQLTNAGVTSYTSDNNGWSVATTGDVVHAVWTRWSPGSSGVYHRRSTDGGVDWSAEVLLSGATGDSIQGISLAVAGDAVHVFWSDYAGGAGIYYARSVDGGATWGSGAILTAPSPYSGTPSAAVVADTVHLVWQDYRDGDAEVYYKRSVNGGATWGVDTRLTSAAGWSAAPSVAATGDTVHVAWEDDRAGNQEIYYKRSTDNGATWSGDTRLTNAAGWSCPPSVAATGAAVHVVWRDDRDGNAEVYYKRSADYGATWGGDTRLTNDGGMSTSPSVAATGDLVRVAWGDDRDGNQEIYYNCSVDGGTTWGSDTRLTDAADYSGNPSVAVAGIEVHVVWEDRRDGAGQEVYYRRYGRRGASIAGMVFCDDNGDGDQDPGERVLPTWTVRLDPGPRFVLTADDGTYLFHSLPAGTYTVSEVVKPNWQQTFPPAPGSYEVTVGPGEEVLGKDFGNQMVGVVQDLAASVAGGIARPGRQKTYAISYENAGTVEVGATVTLNLPPEVDYLSSDPAGVYDPVSHSVTWDVGIPLPGVAHLLTVAVTVHTGVAAGTELTASVTIEPLAGDATPTDNTDSETEEVRAPLDPNMKAVRPEPFISAGDILDYVVYFQNVGNDTAFDIVVRDVLDPGLDISTVEPLAASHPYAFGFDAGSELVWAFNDIKLPDSITDEPASHGFLRFRVRVLAVSAPGTTIGNSAAIYFDFNDPVITNTAQVTVVAPGWTERSNVPDIPTVGKGVHRGAWLVNAGDAVYVAKGYKTSDFYRYWLLGDSWTVLTGMPYATHPLWPKKPPSKGSTGVGDGADAIYVTQGNNTLGFWKYSIGAGTWQVLADVPAGLYRKKVKGGTDMAYVVVNDTGYVYLLKGYKTEFYRYNTGTGAWETLPEAPTGTRAKWDKGSWLCVEGPQAEVIYAHKAKYHELYKYYVSGDSWGPKMPGMPFVGNSGRRKKSKDGGSAAFDDGAIYALKGGNTTEWWRYTVIDSVWTELETMPSNGSVGKKKRVKSGGDVISYGMGYFFALKGNKTVEFWRYGLPVAPAMATLPQRSGVMAQPTGITGLGMTLAPNPLSGGFVTVRYALPAAGPAVINVVDVAGRTVERQVVYASRVGAVNLDLRSLSAGVYLVRFEASGFETTRKLVVQ